MSNSVVVRLIAVLILGLARAAVAADATAAGPAAVASMSRRTPFVIGAPGRLDAEGDRRHPRLYQRADSLVAAYCDVEEVRDGTWLRQEIEGYARRTVDCAGLGRAWCRREVERVGGAPVIHVVSGAHAELVWLSGRTRAVRLGWRRMVDTPTGTMTLDEPPAEFAAEMLAAFPSQLEPFVFDSTRARAWTENEEDRLLYYIDQVVVGLPAVVAEHHRRHALRFVEDGLARLVELHALTVTSGVAAAPHEMPDTPSMDGGLPTRLALQLDAARAWRAERAAEPWCVEQLASSPASSPADDNPDQRPGPPPTR